MLYLRKTNFSNDEDLQLLFKKVIRLEKKLMKKAKKIQQLRTEYESYAYTYLLLMRPQKRSYHTELTSSAL